MILQYSASPRFHSMFAKMTRVVQLDAFGSELRLWAWRAGDNPPPEPQVVAQDNTYESGFVRLLSVTENGNVASFRYVRVADTRLFTLDMFGDLLADVYLLNLHQGIENSLEAKIHSALNALQDGNQNNDVAACNSLEAFINAVEAQSGKKIERADADYLILQAMAILVELGCE